MLAQPKSLLRLIQNEKKGKSGRIEEVADMATIAREEVYTNAVIDAEDNTITEYCNDAVKTYSISDLINRWNGVNNISLIIRVVEAAPSQEEVQ